MISDICQQLIKNNITLSVAESFTGGGVAAMLTKHSGISKIFSCSIVTYSNNAKKELLGVPGDIIEKYGAVSQQCVKEMAMRVRELAKTDVGLSTTGFAGPACGNENHPVGTYFVAIATKNGVYVEKHFCAGNRDEVTQEGIASALALLKTICDDKLK